MARYESVKASQYDGRTPGGRSQNPPGGAGSNPADATRTPGSPAAPGEPGVPTYVHNGCPACLGGTRDGRCEDCGATWKPDEVRRPAILNTARRSDVEAIATIGQHVPQPDGNGGKAIRRGPLPPAAIHGYTLVHEVNGISVHCDRCGESTDPGYGLSLVEVVRDAMLHSERCTG